MKLYQNVTWDKLIPFKEQCFYSYSVNVLTRIHSQFRTITDLDLDVSEAGHDNRGISRSEDILHVVRGWSFFDDLCAPTDLSLYCRLVRLNAIYVDSYRGESRFDHMPWWEGTTSREKTSFGERHWHKKTSSLYPSTSWCLHFDRQQCIHDWFVLNCGIAELLDLWISWPITTAQQRIGKQLSTFCSASSVTLSGRNEII